MTLKPGQYILDNFVPMTYEVIGNDLEEQWENWRGGNGNIVNIFEAYISLKHFICVFVLTERSWVSLPFYMLFRQRDINDRAICIAYNVLMERDCFANAQNRQ